MDKGRDLKERVIGVLMGGLSSEREISLKSGNAVLAGLIRSGYRAVAIDVGLDLVEQLREKEIETAFVALHGRWGEDGTVQGLLEMMGIPYTGSGVLGSALAMDKCLDKALLVALGLPTPEYRICESGHDADLVGFPPPFVVKPACEGSSVGISIVRQQEEIAGAIKNAFDYGAKVLVERFVEGREITVGIVNGLVLPTVEVRPKSGVYDYASKYTKGMTEYLVPAELTDQGEKSSAEAALRVWRHFGLSGCARIDMIVDDGMKPQVIDINTSPGMTETSLVPKAWAHLGRTFDQLVEEILRGASLKA
jgi:D-alanine-D-alanine ligase